MSVSIQDLVNVELDIETIGEFVNGGPSTTVTNRAGNSFPSMRKAIADGVVTEFGLGNAAALDVGTTAGTVAAGDDQRLSYLKPAHDPSRNYVTLSVPETDNVFIDNVLAIQNKSIGPLGRGNAAINFLDSAGVERAASGYSRNKALAPDVGYGPNIYYIEIGNPFTTDAEATDFALIVTHKAGGPFWGGAATAYKAISVSSQNGSIEMTTNGGLGAISLRDDVYFGYDGGPRTVHFNLASTRARLRERGNANQFVLATNLINMAAPSDVAIVRDNNAVSSWAMSIGGGADRFSVQRAGVSDSLMEELLAVDDIDQFILPKGVMRLGDGVTGPMVLSGNGAPTGSVAAPIGSLYLRRDGGTDAALYIKESDPTGSSGWVAA